MKIYVCESEDWRMVMGKLMLSRLDSHRLPVAVMVLSILSHRRPVLQFHSLCKYLMLLPVTIHLITCKWQRKDVTGCSD